MFKKSLVLVLLIASVLTTRAADDRSLVKFLTCHPPFNPTERLHNLIKASIIEPQPSTSVDGIPHFRINGEREVFGLRVIVAAGSNAEDWDSRLYSSAPGTISPALVSLFVVSSKNKATALLPRADRELYSIESESSDQFEKLFPLDPALRKEIFGASITEIACYADRLREH